jgi:hypothetical protein
MPSTAALDERVELQVGNGASHGGAGAGLSRGCVVHRPDLGDVHQGAGWGRGGASTHTLRQQIGGGHGCAAARSREVGGFIMWGGDQLICWVTQLTHRVGYHLTLLFIWVGPVGIYTKNLIVGIGSLGRPRKFCILRYGYSTSSVSSTLSI